jgi:CotH kinase protein
MRHRGTSGGGLIAATVAVFAPLALAAVTGVATASTSEPAPGPAGPIYASGTIAEVDLDLPPESIAALESEPFEYVPGDFTLSFTDGTPGGVTSTLPTLHEVGIRLKGQIEGSFRELDEKAAFKVKFNEFVKQKLLGLKGLTLNNMVQDPSMLHEALAYEAFRAAGVPASRSSYAFIRVNGDAYGVYANVESFDDVALERWFGPFDDDTQHLYEGEYGTDLTPGGAAAFEIDEGDEDDRGDLEALIAAVNASEGDGWANGVAPVADLAEMTRMWGVEKYVGMWDGYAGSDRNLLPNNFFLYSDPFGRFQMFPWGTDQTWGDPVEFDEDAGLMFDRCLADEECRALYVGEVGAAGEAIEALELESLADEIAERLAPWQEMEDDSRREFSAEEIEEGVEETHDFMLDRPDELAEWLKAESEQEPEPEEPEPEGEPAGAASASPAGGVPDESAEGSPPHARLRLAGASAVSVLLRLPAAGKVVAIGRIGSRRGPQRACKTSREVTEPGSVTLRCSLSSAVRKRLRRHWLKLRLTVWFQPQGGLTETIGRKIVVPRIDRR